MSDPETAALVGPFHKHEMYARINVEGTKNVIKACKSQGVRPPYSNPFRKPSTVVLVKALSLSLSLSLALSLTHTQHTRR